MTIARLGYPVDALLGPWSGRSGSGFDMARRCRCRAVAASEALVSNWIGALLNEIGLRISTTIRPKWIVTRGLGDMVTSSRCGIIPRCPERIL